MRPRSSSRSFIAVLLAAPLAASFAACSALDPLALGTCGNGVLDPGEQCDRIGEGEPGARMCGDTCKYLCTVTNAKEMCNPGDACRISGDAPGGSGVCESADVCGNNRREPGSGEDCDGSELGPGAEEASCGPPESTTAPCRFVCGEGQKCPTGYACAPDLACVHHAGTFDAPTRVPFAGLDLVLADYDGDQNPDLSSIFGHDLEISYGDGFGGFLDSRRVAFQTPTFNFVAADFDRDGNDDAVVPQTAGLSILRGRPDRTFVAKLDAAIPIGMASPDGLRTANVRTSSTGSNDLIFGTGYGQGRFLAFIVEPGVPGSPRHFYGFETMLTPADVLDLTVAELDSRDPSPEEEVIIALSRDDRLRIVSPECFGGGPECEWGVIFRSETLLPDVAGGAPKLGDLDGDGILDIIIPVGGEDRGGMMRVDRRLVTGRGTGDGRFVSFEEGDALLAFDEGIEQLFERMIEEPGIAGTADFNHDGIADLITEDFVAISTGPRAWVRTPSVALFGPSVSSVVGDFNGDGELDFASASSIERGLTFFLGRGDGEFRSTFVATNNYPVHLDTGDFDGDGVSDVAAAESPGFFSLLATTISVTYGNAFQLPSASVEMGELPRIGQINAFDLYFPPARADGIDDLVVVSDPTEGVGPGVTILFGNASRRLFSPLTLATEDTQPDTPVAVTRGDFDGDSLPDLFVIGSTSAWMLSGQPGGLTLANSRAVALRDAPLQGCLRPASPMCSLLVAGNVIGEPEGQRVDEVVFLDSCDVRFRGPGMPPEVTLHITWMRVPRAPENWTCGRLDLPVSVYRARGVHIGDLDGDLRDDLALAFSGNDVPPGFGDPEEMIDPRSMGVLVFWSADGGRGFNTDDMTMIDHGMLEAAPTGVGAIGLDRDDEDELAVLTSGRLRFFKVSRAAGTIEELRGKSRPAGEASILSKIVARDVSSDGLEDLLIKDQNGVEVLLSRLGGRP